MVDTANRKIVPLSFNTKSPKVMLNRLAKFMSQPLPPEVHSAGQRLECELRQGILHHKTTDDFAAKLAQFEALYSRQPVGV